LPTTIKIFLSRCANAVPDEFLGKFSKITYSRLRFHNDRADILFYGCVRLAVFFGHGELPRVHQFFAMSRKTNIFPKTGSPRVPSAPVRSGPQSPPQISHAGHVPDTAGVLLREGTLANFPEFQAVGAAAQAKSRCKKSPVCLSKNPDLSVPLAEVATNAGFSAYFITAHELVTDPARATQENRPERRLRVYLAPKLLVILEMG
jgi:hypothetical protein